MIKMLQTLYNHNIIGKQLSCYSERTAGMLGRTILARDSCVPLQQQFADINTRISIPVYNKPTGLAFVFSVITATYLIQNSTSATSFGSITNLKNPRYLNVTGAVFLIPTLKGLGIRKTRFI
jgi:hypothetical protein